MATGKTPDKSLIDADAPITATGGSFGLVGGLIGGPTAGDAVEAQGSMPPDIRRFLDLNIRFPLRPIRSEGELSRANATIAELLDRGSLDASEEDYLDVLGDLVWKYERVAHPLPEVPAEEMLRHLLESRGMTQAELSRGTGITEPTISAILAGKRRLNRRHIELVSAFLEISPAVFLPSARLHAR